LRALGALHPEWAGKLRQGEPQQLGPEGLVLFFPPLFDSHRESLAHEEVLSAIELVLEEQFETPLHLVMTGAKVEELVEVVSAEEDELFASHGQDPSAIIVQKVFGVKIRNVFSDHQQAPYHLGLSSHFKSEKSRDGF
jgi:hypothetical protein